MKCIIPDCEDTDTIGITGYQFEMCKTHNILCCFFYYFPDFLEDHTRWPGQWIEITSTFDLRQKYINLETKEIRYGKVYNYHPHKYYDNLDNLK